ncbi:MAG: hypothetical protein ABI622_02195 [Chloroflexota bacterium]
MGLLTRLSLVLVLSACAAQTDAPAAASPSFLATPASVEAVTLSDGSVARAWGDGPYGVVLIGGPWDAVAVELARHGMRALVPDEATADVLRAAIGDLHGVGIERVAVVAVDAGVRAAFEVGTDEPDQVDQLITLSAVGNVSPLGDFPKLFVASRDEPAAGAATEMADRAAGEWNVELLVPGGASGLAILDGPGADALLDGILRRLEERR